MIGLSSYTANVPQKMSGLIFIISHTLNSDSPLLIDILVLASVVCGFLVVRNSALDGPSSQTAKKAASLSLLVASILFLTPLHAYDLVSLAAILMLLIATPSTGRWLSVVGL